MRTTEKRLQGLVVWARENLPRMRHKPASIVADHLGDQILSIHDGLGVEVADDDSGPREVIITAFSDPHLFALVRRITEMFAEIPDWRFLALKPPRGFAFCLSVGQERIAAKSLEFAPIPGTETEIRLLVPLATGGWMPSVEQAEEMAWLVVETGIGEELAGRLQHIEFASDRGIEDWHPIIELDAYVRTISG